MHTSYTPTRLTRLLLVASSSAATASPRANLLSRSVLCQGLTRVCLHISSLSTMCLDILRQRWTSQRTRMTCRELSNGRRGFGLKARRLLNGYWTEERAAVTEGAIGSRVEVVSQRHLDGKRINHRCRAYPCIVQLAHITVPNISNIVKSGFS